MTARKIGLLRGTNIFFFNLEMKCTLNQLKKNNQGEMQISM